MSRATRGKLWGLRRPAAGVPPYRAGKAASATEPRVLPEASSVKKPGSRPIRVTVGRPKVCAVTRDDQIEIKFAHPVKTAMANYSGAIYSHRQQVRGVSVQGWPVPMITARLVRWQRSMHWDWPVCEKANAQPLRPSAPA